jgi:hypothetical protein
MHEPATRLTDAELVAGADQQQLLFARHQRAFFRYIAEVDARRLWDADGCRDVAQWISGRYDVPLYQARRWADAAHALARLPLISHAFENGRLGIDKTVQLARFATPATEKDLLAWARRVTTRTVRRTADREVRATTDEVADPERDRSLTWWLCDDDKRVAIEALLPAAEGMMAVRAIDRLAERAHRDPELIETACDEADARSFTQDQRRADAFVELCSGSLDADFDADRATVVVHAELDRMISGSGGEIDGGPVIPADVLRQLACDCRLELVVSDGERGVVGVGRATREPPPWLYRQVLRRDGGCRFPGCGARRHIHAHHIRHWIDGGPTDLDNLVIACGFHHRLIHKRGWDVKLSAAGGTTWFRPDGRVYDPASEVGRGRRGPPGIAA